jgi:tRNA pseudouridine38-40 synthase
MSALRVVRLDLAYDGTEFSGFSVQPGRRTVQGVLEDAWFSITSEQTRFTPAGRTDAGVHAAQQVVSVRTCSPLASLALLRALNSRLPMDVVITDAAEAPISFDARREAVRRHYEYSLWNHRIRTVRHSRFSWQVYERLDLNAMQRASGRLVGLHDFQAFCARLSQQPPSDTVRTIYGAEWLVDQAPLLRFSVNANGFLRHMVRGIVGALVGIGAGRMTDGDLDRLFNGEANGLRGAHAPAHGLSLVRVDFE